MKPLQIALLDLNHATRGVTTNTVPLGIGLIAAYLDTVVGSGQVETRMYKNHDLLRHELDDWVPDVVGVALFNHNMQLNLYHARLIRERNPDCLVVAGGPNQPIETGRRQVLLRQNPVLDLCCTQDGEIPFAQAVTRFLAGESRRDLRQRPVDGGYALDPDTSEIVLSPNPTPHLSSLDIFGPLYARGFFDAFLDAGCYPYIQTHRGCPFSCAFCTSGQSWHSAMRFLSPDIFDEEMQALGRRFANRPEIPLQLANTNMSLFEQDVAIAEILARCQRDFGWPQTIHTNSGKDTAKLLRMQKIVSFMPDVALQTLTPQVLKNIGRRNIPLDEFQALQREMLRQGKVTTTELILSLPGESKASFLATLAEVARTGVQRIVVYTQMHLSGTVLSSLEWEEKAGFVIRHRVVPRTFSRIGQDLVLDTEEVVVGTTDMPLEDYFELRGLVFTMEVIFNAVEFSPIRRVLLERGADPWEWICLANELLPRHPRLAPYYQSYLAETQSELFNTREDLLDFFGKPENEQALLQGRLGDNLLRKFKFQVLSQDFAACLEIALQAADAILTRGGPDPSLPRLLQDLRQVLSLRDYKLLQQPQETWNVSLRYDVPSWLAGETGRPLHTLAGRFEYLASQSAEGRDRLARLGAVHGDRELTLQLLFQYAENTCLWPSWSLLASKEDDLVQA